MEKNEKDEKILNIARQFVEAKIPFANDFLKNEIAEELYDKIEDAINLEVMSNMTGEQVQEYIDLLETGKASESDIISFINKCNMDLNIVTTVALTKVRMAYLGA